MTDEDKATSFRVLRHRLFITGYTKTIDADEDELRSALIALLRAHVGSDGVWAARSLIGINDDQDQSHPPARQIEA